jgi:hypothetical protein
MGKSDVPITHRKRAHLSQRKKDYESMTQEALNETYIQIVGFLDRKWQRTDSNLAEDGTPYNDDQWTLALAKVELVELELQRRLGFPQPPSSVST